MANFHWQFRSGFDGCLCRWFFPASFDLSSWEQFPIYWRWRQHEKRLVSSIKATRISRIVPKMRWYVFVSPFRWCRGRKLLNCIPRAHQTNAQEEEDDDEPRKLFCTKLNSMIHERDRHIAHHFSWALNEVFYRNSVSHSIGMTEDCCWCRRKLQRRKVCLDLFLSIFSTLERCQKRVKYLFKVSLFYFGIKRKKNVVKPLKVSEVTIIRLGCKI